jgi:hypothetical protein
MIPLDEWPVVEPEEVPKVSAKQLKHEQAQNDAWTAREREAYQYLKDMGDATNGMGEDEVNEFCAQMEEWNEAVR